MTGKLADDRLKNTARELRRLRVRRLGVRLLVGVVLPTILAGVYFGAIVTPEYESVSAVTVQAADGGTSPHLELLFAAVPTNAGRDARLVHEHALSRDMLDHLAREHGFREHYASPEVDWFSRLPDGAGSEDVYEYYRDHVEMDYDTASGMLLLTVRAFDAEAAERFSAAILARSESMVNDLAVRARDDRIALAQRELERAEERLGAARRAVSDAQGEGGELNPLQSAAALYEMRAQLEVEIASARAEVSAAAATLPQGSPEITAQRRRVAALERQLVEQNQRLTGEDGASLRAAIARFEPLIAEKEFAQRAYASALTSLEVARVDAARQHRYLVKIAGPSRPTAPSHPDVPWSVFTVFLLSFALLTIGSLLVASVREHANV